MTLKEAKEYLEHMLRMMADEPPTNLTDIRDIKEWEDEHSKIRDTLEISLSALEELEQYRALGTVEELKEAREKQVAKKPKFQETGEKELYKCPCCNYELMEIIKVENNRYQWGRVTKYCERCGQRLREEGGTSD